MSMQDKITKWLHIRKNVYGILGTIVIVLILWADFSYWAGAIETGVIQTEIIGGQDDGLNDTGNFTVITWEENLTITGSFIGGGPGGLLFADDRQPFEVADTVAKVHVVLTWDPQSTDLDLDVEDASGRVVGSSGNAPGEPQEVTVEKVKTPGQWNIVVDPYLNGPTTYNAVITLTHEEKEENCTDGSCGVPTDDAFMKFVRPSFFRF